MIEPLNFPFRKTKRNHAFRGKFRKPKSTFTTFMDEGFIHYRAGHFRKALYCFDRALEIQPANKKALVSRSQCHLKLGDAASALKDAQASFDKKSTYIDGLFQYSEALYNLGKFEKALIAYYRGHRIRRDMETFRIGVQKCTSAIMSAIGNHASTQMEDLEIMLPLIRELEYINGNHVIHCCIRPGIGEGKVHVERQSILKAPSVARSRWVAREMLGELYYDKSYLNKFLARPDVKNEATSSGKMLRVQAREALNYLSIREDFWRQMYPMYTKKFGLNFNNTMVQQYEKLEKERQEANRRIKMDAAQGAVMKNINTIEHAVSINRPKDSLLECGRTLRQIKDISIRLLPRKREYTCLLLHYKGLSELMMRNYDLAISTFQKELELTVDQVMPEIKSRALDCLGKVFVKKKLYLEAADAWETRMAVVKAPLERAYMFHELAHCYYGLKKLEISVNYAEMAIEEALKINDKVWLMNSYFFLAKVQSKYHNKVKGLQLMTVQSLMVMVQDFTALAKQDSLELAYQTMQQALLYSERLQDKTMTKKLTECVYCIKAWIEKKALEERQKEEALHPNVAPVEEEEEPPTEQQKRISDAKRSSMAPDAAAEREREAEKIAESDKRKSSDKSTTSMERKLTGKPDLSDTTSNAEIVKAKPSDKDVKGAMAKPGDKPPGKSKSKTKPGTKGFPKPKPGDKPFWIARPPKPPKKGKRVKVDPSKPKLTSDGPPPVSTQDERIAGRVRPKSKPVTKSAKGPRPATTTRMTQNDKSTQMPEPDSTTGESVHPRPSNPEAPKPTPDGKKTDPARKSFNSKNV